MTDAAVRLKSFVADELGRPTSPAAHAFAQNLAQSGGGGVLGVLFYGSALRTGATDGLFDFYVLLDDLSSWDAGALARAGNRVLPPNVEYAEFLHEGARLRAKVAVLTLGQFRRHARAKSCDTTIWARFTQPAALAFARDAAAADAVAAAVAGAARAAAWWAAHLGPGRGPAAAFWAALFARTYASELRVENAGRPSLIVEQGEARYAALLPLAWEAEGVAFARDAMGALAPAIATAARADAQEAWGRRSRIAKPLNILRLAKAAFTFSGGADYIAWKIERHTGRRIEVTPFQRRHPALSAAPALWRLWRSGVLR